MQVVGSWEVLAKTCNKVLILRLADWKFYKNKYVFKFFRKKTFDICFNIWFVYLPFVLQATFLNMKDSMEIQWRQWTFFIMYNHGLSKYCLFFWLFVLLCTSSWLNATKSQLSSDHAALTDGRWNSRVGRMYQHATMDKGPHNPETILPVGMYSDQDGYLRHLPAHEIWRRRDRSTGGIPEQSTRSLTDIIRVFIGV
jgi:hypothetical protein